jgi:hypothetical protein
VFSGVCYKNANTTRVYLSNKVAIPEQLMNTASPILELCGESLYHRVNETSLCKTNNDFKSNSKEGIQS